MQSLQLQLFWKRLRSFPVHGQIMSTLNKITVGFVVQVFDPETKKFISQEFFAGDQCDYENKDGERVDPSLFHKDGQEVYLSYDMVQPQ
jgi:hypothetical protein